MKGPGMILPRSSTRTTWLLAGLADHRNSRLPAPSAVGRADSDRPQLLPAPLCTGSHSGLKLVSLNQEEGPSLSGGVGWINTGPINLAELRGKIVLLDFWTFCCINCHHVLPDLAKLEEKYKNELVVIGVHTAKFDAEQDTENIRRKVREYRIKHPVVNDAEPGDLEPLRRAELADARPDRRQRAVPSAALAARATTSSSTG